MKNYFSNTVVIELSSAIFIFILIICLSYFLYLKNPLAQLQIAQKNNRAMTTQLLQKKAQQLSEHAVLSALSHWKDKNVDFYNAIQSSLTLNQLLQQLADTAKKNGISISEIKPLIDTKNKFKKNKVMTHRVELKVTGLFQSLFLFIAAINTSQYPVRLDMIKIDHSGVFKLQFTVWGTRD